MDFKEEHALETYKSLVLYGSTGLKFVLVANGGAAIAVLTFLGHFVAEGKPNPPDLRWPLGTFLVGVLIGGFGIATAYFTQLTLYNEAIGARSGRETTTHVFWLRVSVVAILLGMLCFGAGAISGVIRLK